MVRHGGGGEGVLCCVCVGGGGWVWGWAGDSQHFGPILSAMSKPTQKNSFFFNKFLRLRAKSELAPL